MTPPSFSSPHSLHLYQRAPSCGNNVRLALLLTGCRSQSSAQFLRGDQEPWAFRGGLAGEFQVSNAPNLQQSNGKKEKKKKKCCEQRRRWYYVRRYEGVWSVKGELIAVSYTHDIQAPSPPLHLQICLCSCPDITLGHWQYV